MYKQPKLFGKDDDGEYEARIEQIGTSKNEYTLMISTRKPNLWVFSILNGYRQLGCFKTKNLHLYNEGQDIIVVKRNNKIVEIK